MIAHLLPTSRPSGLVGELTSSGSNAALSAVRIRSQAHRANTAVQHPCPRGGGFLRFAAVAGAEVRTAGKEAARAVLTAFVLASVLVALQCLGGLR